MRTLLGIAVLLFVVMGSGCKAITKPVVVVGNDPYQLVVQVWDDRIRGGIARSTYVEVTETGDNDYTTDGWTWYLAVPPTANQVRVKVIFYNMYGTDPQTIWHTIRLERGLTKGVVRVNTTPRT